MGIYRENTEFELKMSQKAASLEIKTWNDNVKMKLGYVFSVILCDKMHHCPLRPFHIKAGSTALTTIPLSECDD
jgi:hypothetical protein